MVTTTSPRNHGVSVAQVVARRQVKMHLKKIRDREYSKLRALVPSVASKKKVTKVQVIEEAARYIEELHAALMERFRQQHGSIAEDKAQETVQVFVSRMMNRVSNVSSSSNSGNAAPFRPLVIRPSSNTDEKQRNHPSVSLRTKRNI